MALTPAAARTAPAPVRADALAGSVTAAVLVLVGAPLGLLWAALAPRVRTDVRDVDLETLFIGSREGSFALLCVTAGVLAGSAAWWLGRRHGPGVVLGLLIGGGLGGAVAAHVGQVRSREGVEAGLAATAATVRAPVEVSPEVALVVLPLAALAVFALLVAVLERPQRSAGAP